MRISLEGVGALPNISMRADGITVISGLNNTGKSTILKAIYSVLSPSADFDLLKDIQIADAFRIIRLKYDGTSQRIDVQDQDFEDVTTLIKQLDAIHAEDKDREIIEYVKRLHNGEEDSDFYDNLVRRTIVSEFDEIEQFKNIGIQIPAKISFEEGLDLTCTVDEEVSVSTNIRAIPRTIYYDSPFNIDSSIPTLVRRRYLAALNHRDNIASLLNFQDSGDRENIIIDSSRLNNIRIFDDALEKNIPGHLINTKSGLKYKSGDGRELSVKNVAAGIKVFGILRMLVDKGYLEKGSILLLDEPEVHLHPLWINVLADALIILSRDLGVKIIMATHNPQLMMAIEAKTSNMKNCRSFYHLSRTKDGTLEFSEITECLETAYDEMAGPVEEVASLFWE